MTESRKLAAILVTDIVGYSRLAGADEDRILARLRTLRSDLIEPTISVHRGRVVKGTGDGFIVEFRSVVDAVRCAIELQHGLLERNAGLPPERRRLSPARFWPDPEQRIAAWRLVRVVGATAEALDRDPMRRWWRRAIWQHEVATTHSGGDHARRS